MKSIQIGRLYFQSYRGFVRHFSRFPPITTTAAASRSILSKDLHPPVEVQNKSNRLSTSSMLATPSVLGCLPADLVIVGEPASSSSSDPSVVEVGESSQNYASCELVKAATLPNKVECAIYQCSQSAAQKFSDLFPDRDLSKMDVCVITLTHKTLNDMSVWNMHVEEEREQLMQSFVEAATNVCKQLQQAGYWADFIDPYSSTPHFGAHTNSTLEETDPRNCLFGVHIEDLGCCRVIRHLTWGTHAFVGTIFTNVPADHSFII